MALTKLILAVVIGLSLVTAQNAPSDVRVMSYNIRYGTAPDGENHWDKRKDFLVRTIKAFDPDLLGTQETLGFQRDYLAANLTGYEVLGVGRDDGRGAGEMMALYFKSSRFERIDGGHFWLSETPDQPGSKGWDTSLPRMVTWVKLRDRKNPRARPIAYLNTHFDHRGTQARLESARLIRRRIEELNKSCRVILTGDFNTGEGSEPYVALFGKSDKGDSPVRDTFRAVNPTKTGSEITFTNFNSNPGDGPRIDWIGVSRDWKIVSAGIDRTTKDGRTPSDHYAVTAVVR